MIGQTISHYKILEKLGEGGMGVVYKAEDTKLDRLVALKFLPSHLAASEQDKARFIQEAKAAAALNHPNICTIYSVEEHDGQLFIAMEFVDGQTLREKRDMISFKQSIDIGIQVADGLSAAHEKGIVHRDIKPENIMIRKDGIAQVMDFGLAKLRSSGSKITRLTKEGSTVGTAGYMSPEQVQGQDTDHRSDIFSFGVLLYEMLTGQLPFKGVHETALLYEIVNLDAPPMSSIKPDIDPSLDSIVLECLAKEPSERYQSVAEIGKELRRYKRESSRTRVSRVTSTRSAYSAAQSSSQIAAQGVEPIPAAKSKRELVVTLLAIVLFLGLAGLMFIHYRESAPAMLKAHFILQPPSGLVSTGQPNVSPDGQMIAFIATDTSDKRLIWVRPLDAAVERSLGGTDDASGIIWSPDSRFIAFPTAKRQIKKVLVKGGAVETIGNLPGTSVVGASWGTKGVIVFAPQFTGPLYRISASGGSQEPATSLDSTRGEIAHRFPVFLPDGEHFLFHIESSQVGDNGIFVSSLSSKEKRRILNADVTVPLFAPDYILFTQEGTLLAQPFDASRMELKGQLKSLADRVFLFAPFVGGGYSISSNGVLAYRHLSGQTTQLVWFDRKGNRLGVVGEAGLFSQISLAPDGKRLVVQRYETQGRETNLWLLDLTRNVMSRFTSEKGMLVDPVWSPDGKKIVYVVQPKLYIKSLSATQPELLLDSPDTMWPDDFTPDGRFVVIHWRKQKEGIALVPVEGGQQYKTIIESNYQLDEPQISPDSKWIAYISNESGKWEVYVQPFMREGERIRVSTTGGGQPRWRKDGKELLYLALDGYMMAVDVKSGSTMEVGTPKLLFNTRIVVNPVIDQFVFTSDAQKFLVVTNVGESGPPPFHVVLNWDADLKKE